MKANELTIGDRVFIAGSPTRTIKQLTKHKVGYIANDYDTRVYYTRTEFVFGIPLTAEILKKNGWFHIDRDGYCDNINFCIEKGKGGYYCYEIPQIKFNYVHELQHILRSCGLNDLADNFKV